SDSPPENNTDVVYAGNFSVWGKIDMVGSQTDSFTAFSITQTTGELFVLTVNATNPGPATAYDVSISVADVDNILGYNPTNYDCGNLTVGEMCSREFLVTVPAKTTPKKIIIENTIWWDNPDKTANTIIGETNVIVAKNLVIDIIENSIMNQTPHGKTTQIGTLTIISAGNVRLENITLDLVGGAFYNACPRCNLTILPNYKSNLLQGDYFISDIFIDVPYGEPPKNNWTYISANAIDSNEDLVVVDFTIPSDVSWNTTPSTFGTILALVNTNTTHIGTIFAQNNGNSKRTINVYVGKNGSSFVTTDVDAFSLSIGANSSVNINYSIPYSTAPGMYLVNIDLDDSSGTPPSVTTDFWLNVTDIPPVISNVSIEPMGYEPNVGYSNINATITDNVAISKVWINSTKPGNIEYVEYITLDGTSAYLNYSENETGIHKIKICANDTASLVICTPIYDISVMVNTTVITETNITNVTINGVMFNSGLNVTFNFTTLNDGFSRAIDVNTSVTYPASWNVTPAQWFMGNITTTPYTDEAILSIPKDIIGNYTINFTSNWTNYDSTNDTKTTPIKIVIGSNPVLNLSEELETLIIEVGKNKTANFTIDSIGNDIAENIEFNCTSDTVCTDFNVSFNPQSITNITKGNSSNASITVSVPIGYPTGIYNGVINIYTLKTNLLENITVIVPENVSWSHNPTILSKEVIANTTGDFGSVLVSNIGNKPLMVSALSTNTTLFSLNESMINLPVGNASRISINYTAPEIYTLQT
ncbi:MAG: hypothetical protein KAS12_03745, partial [Candidatus Aenigmarchaeota archaeon]|nr:hypothetical protein [Candidatus Aenigmarchaeota archaeon]